jgi:hypothetical protein
MVLVGQRYLLVGIRHRVRIRRGEMVRRRRRVVRRRGVVRGIRIGRHRHRGKSRGTRASFDVLIVHRHSGEEDKQIEFKTK